ncbi:hypothetical protein DFH28DRAFT_1131370 [Melampsora americana]|nr:hypothetical protein DFH28DRAFT_1131370 [Melampsora americana]
MIYNIYKILSGGVYYVSVACRGWKEALAAHLLWVYPTCRHDGLGPVMKTVTENWPIDQTSITNGLTSSILTGSLLVESALILLKLNIYKIHILASDSLSTEVSI